MSRYQPGDRVRVVSVTPAAGREPITDPAHPGAIDWTGKTLIGKTGTVLDVFAERHVRNNIRLDHLAEAVAFPDADLEPKP
ncbi:hypothetical protein ABQE93_10940 [Mycolicibacterium sp. XJ662]